MLLKHYLSKTLKSVSTYAILLALSGFVSGTSSLAMEEDQDEEQALSLLSLPREIQVQIMDQPGVPSRMALVSRYFYQLSGLFNLYINTEEKLRGDQGIKTQDVSSLHNICVRLPPSCKLQASDLGVLLQSPHLRFLDLSNNPIDDESAIILINSQRKNTSLTELNLSNTGISYKTLEELTPALKSKSSLKSLFLSGNPFGKAQNIRDDDFLFIGRDISNMPSLKLLELNNTSLTPTMMIQLYNAFRNKNSPVELEIRLINMPESTLVFRRNFFSAVDKLNNITFKLE